MCAAFFRRALTLVPVALYCQDVSMQGPGSAEEPSVMMSPALGEGAAAVASPMREPLLIAAPSDGR